MKGKDETTCSCPKCGHRYSHGGEVQKEEQEHPWMSEKQAERVARDHARERGFDDRSYAQMIRRKSGRR